MKICLQVISLLLCIGIYLSCASVPASAIVVNYVVPVAPVIQAKSNWCWAACAEMCGKTIAPSSTRTQYDVVKYIKGDTYNVGGNKLECANGCKYVALSEKDFIIGYMDFSVIGNRTGRNEALVAFGEPTEGSGGHTFLIRGSQFVDGSGSTQYNIDYINPSNGNNYHCSYESFCNGEYNNFICEFMTYTK
ncbi:MAG: hypothetical protein HDT43_06830 [Ruminococcaceae bacterium]|nr:hypothetical protein [Oscillospiraceae bacterium]